MDANWQEKQERALKAREMGRVARQGSRRASATRWGERTKSAHTHPLFEAHHSERYARQNLTAQYEDLTGAALIVVIDQIFHENLTSLEKLLFDCAEVHSLHVLLASPGG